jgi:hypothetical protein
MSALTYSIYVSHMGKHYHSITQEYNMFQLYAMFYSCHLKLRYLAVLWNGSWYRFVYTEGVTEIECKQLQVAQNTLTVGCPTAIKNAIGLTIKIESCKVYEQSLYVNWIPLRYSTFISCLYYNCKIFSPMSAGLDVMFLFVCLFSRQHADVK